MGMVLRKEIETLIGLGDEALMRSVTFIDNHPNQFWNLLYAFQRIGLKHNLDQLIPQSKILCSEESDIDSGKHSLDNTPPQGIQEAEEWTRFDHYEVSVWVYADNCRGNQNERLQRTTAKATLWVRSTCDGLCRRRQHSWWERTAELLSRGAVSVDCCRRPGKHRDPVVRLALVRRTAKLAAPRRRAAQAKRYGAIVPHLHTAPIFQCVAATVLNNSSFVFLRFFFVKKWGHFSFDCFILKSYTITTTRHTHCSLFSFLWVIICIHI